MAANGKLLTSDAEKANAFANHYAKTSYIKLNRADRSLKNRVVDDLKKPCTCAGGESKTICSAFTPNELCRAMEQLRDKKRPGPDEITNECLKHLSPFSRTHLLAIYNKSWTHGVTPKEWRQAICNSAMLG
jgi:hypothetical protein